MNVTLSINESASLVIVSWAKPPASHMNGELQGYRLSHVWQNSDLSVSMENQITFGKNVP